MFFVSLPNGKELHFRWQYVDKKRITYCFMSVDHGPETPFVAKCFSGGYVKEPDGTSHYEWPDEWNKVKGRKTVLKSAIQDMDKETRTIVWKAYFEMEHGKLQKSSRPMSTVTSQVEQVASLERG